MEKIINELKNVNGQEKKALVLDIMSSYDDYLIYLVDGAIFPYRTLYDKYYDRDGDSLTLEDIEEDIDTLAEVIIDFYDYNEEKEDMTYKEKVDLLLENIDDEDDTYDYNEDGFIDYYLNLERYKYLEFERDYEELDCDDLDY